MHRSLRDEAIGCRKTQKGSDESRDAEKEKIPMKARWFLEGKLRSLGNEGRDVVVKKEELQHGLRRILWFLSVNGT